MCASPFWALPDKGLHAEALGVTPILEMPD
ncbi:hypothetical protein R75465_06028 [Paraburkholderia aspalathi]|nr:hypothetical protein R75465_06028 [Paraburkholderia aspalathi]